MTTNSGTTVISDRRQRYRSFMKRFNPTASPKAAIGEGLICRDPGRSVFKKLAAGADLAPGSQQLVVGGIGSGKTTQLLLAERELAAHELTLPVYIDVSAQTDLSAVNSGALLASLGIRLSELVTSRFSKDQIQSSGDLPVAFRAIEREAYGYEVRVPPAYEPDYEPDHYEVIKVPGRLMPPFPPLRRDVKELAQSVSKLVTFLKAAGLELVTIFDGLDRLIRPDQFWAVAEQDLRAIRPLEISVLAAGPLSVMYGQGRQIKDYFEEVHYLPPAIADPKKSPFLLEILRLRSAQELMDEDQMTRICSASGGVLRDLISLARGAGENAYLDDADTIDVQHVDRAIEQLGNSYLLGLGTRQKERLEGLLQGGGFSPSDPEGMELLITRRVLELSESRYEVHPALAGVLSRATGSQ